MASFSFICLDFQLSALFPLDLPIRFRCTSSLPFQFEDTKLLNVQYQEPGADPGSRAEIFFPAA